MPWQLKGDAAHFTIELRPATPYFRLDLIRRCAKRLEQSSEAVHHQRAIEKKLNPNPESDPTQAHPNANVGQNITIAIA